MDLDLKMIFSIVGLVEDIKKTYRTFVHKDKSKYQHPQFKYLKNRYPPNRRNIKPPPRNHGFWI